MMEQESSSSGCFLLLGCSGFLGIKWGCCKTYIHAIDIYKWNNKTQEKTKNKLLSKNKFQPILLCYQICNIFAVLKFSFEGKKVIEKLQASNNDHMKFLSVNVCSIVKS